MDQCPCIIPLVLETDAKSVPLHSHRGDRSHWTRQATPAIHGTKGVQLWDMDRNCTSVHRWQAACGYPTSNVALPAEEESDPEPLTWVGRDRQQGRTDSRILPPSA